MPKPSSPSAKDTVLTTDRLTLRAARQSDLDDLFEIYSTKQAMRYWSSAADLAPENTQKRLDRMIPDNTGPLTYFVVEHQGKAIGTAGGHRNAEVGFILHPDYWRQGLITEAMTAIIAHLWQVLDVPELMADADPNNEASVGLLKSLGFQITGTEKNTFCINGVWSNSVYLTLPRPV